MTHEQQVAYWKVNLRYIIWILAIWFSVSYLAGIIFADALDAMGKIRRLPHRLLVCQPGLPRRLRRADLLVRLADEPARQEVRRLRGLTHTRHC